MEKLKIREFTTSADGWCLFGSKKEAVDMFNRLGLHGETILCNVITPEGEIYPLWVHKGETGFSFLPVFHLNLDEIDLRSALIKPVPYTMLLYHKKKDKGGIAFVAVFAGDDIIIRIMKIIPDQYMLEAYCAFQGIVPKEVRLCRIYTVQENRYVTVCWSVCYESYDLDEQGTVAYETFLLVDFADSDKFQELSFSSLNEFTLQEKEFFKVQGQIYRVLRDEQGKLFITKDCFSPEKARDQVRAKLTEQEEDDEDEKTNKKSRIIPLRSR